MLSTYSLSRMLQHLHRKKLPIYYSLPFLSQKKYSTAQNLRPVRQEPEPVRLGFYPDEWFTCFFDKTGVSGCATFFFTVGITLMSKELYVMDHEFYGGLSMAILCVLTTKYVGPMLAKMLDDDIAEYEESWNKHRDNNKQIIENKIKHEQELQRSFEGQLLLVEAKRENVHLQREAVFRERLMHAYIETTKRLEYCASRNSIEKAIAKRCMSDWVIEEVQKAVTKEIEDQSINKCMADLKTLGDAYKSLEAPYDPELFKEKEEEAPPKKPEPKKPDPKDPKK